MTRSISTNRLVFLLPIAVYIGYVHVQKLPVSSSGSCMTPLNKVGNCVSIKDCSDLLWLLLNKKDDQKAVAFLRDSQCGYDYGNPKVCCRSYKFSNGSRQPLSTTTVAVATTAKKVVPTTRLSPLNIDCGTTEITQRIIGGEGTQAGDYPWMASLGYKKKDEPKPQWFCGATLISRRYVVTAGHCVTGITPWELSIVRLGDVNLNDTVEDNASPKDFHVENIFLHKRYSSSPIVNDIALIKLKENVKFTPYIKPICLPIQPEFRTNVLENKTGYVAGWGRTSPLGPFSTALLDLKIPILSVEVCKKAYHRRPGSHIDNRNLCAGYLSGEKDSCQGDSGGPLMWLNQTDSRYYVVGIVSYGLRCAERGYPGVYTRVSEYIDWITSNEVTR